VAKKTARANKQQKKTVEKHDDHVQQPDDIIADLRKALSDQTALTEQMRSENVKALSVITGLTNDNAKLTAVNKQVDDLNALVE